MIEFNEAIACIRELNIDIELPKQQGSGLAIGQPIDCTGARKVVSGMHQMLKT